MALRIIAMAIVAAGVFYVSLIFRPVPIPPLEECLKIEGIVDDIWEGGEKDACFRIRGNSSVFYFNRSLENGLNLDTLRATLLHNRVTIYYPAYFTPLDPSESIRHATQLEYAGHVVYSEYAPRSELP